MSAEELHGWYAAADAYLALSEDESFGMTLLEAASAGAPVVASDIPALLAHTRDVILLQDGEMAVITKDRLELMKISDARAA